MSRTSQVLYGVVQHKVEQLIKPLEDPRSLSPAGELHSNGLVKVFAQVQNGFLPLLVLLFPITAAATFPSFTAWLLLS